MNNNQFEQLYKLLKVRKSHSGFTLLELLSGLMMSTMVIVGLSYGLVQLTRTTRDETNKVTARNESSRAIEFISDEVRRAQSIEVDNSQANIDAVTDNNYSEPPDIDSSFTVVHRLALRMPEFDDSNPRRIIYSVVKPHKDDSVWNGPLVIYRWGPILDGNGKYTTTWQNRALIDSVDDSVQTATCNGANETYQGFFACIVDDDNDGIIEDGLTDTNGDGVVDLNDSTDDVDGLAITAQLYFSSDIDIANTDTYDQEYTAETQVVARARVRNTNAQQAQATTPLRFRTLAAEYSLGTRGGVTECNGEKSWTMRTDFINDPNLDQALGADPNQHYKPTTWIHDEDRQGQQIDIDTNHKLTISSIPIGFDTCTGPEPISRGNKTLDDKTSTHTKAGNGSPWVVKDDDNNSELDFETSDFTIDFSDPTTFNGIKENNPNYDDPNIQGVDHVKVYKKGSILADYSGYDDNTTDTNDPEDSLGEFLVSKGYAVSDGSGGYRLVNDDDYAADNSLKILEDNERIIAVEIGQALVGDKLPDGTTPNPGFDMQDSVFILSTDKFDDEFPASDF